MATFRMTLSEPRPTASGNSTYQHVVYVTERDMRDEKTFRRWAMSYTRPMRKANPSIQYVVEPVADSFSAR